MADVKPFLMSAKLMRVLRAVDTGRVERVAGRKKSKITTPDGVGETAVWEARLNGFVQDGPNTRVGMTARTVQVLTEEGRKMLMEGDEK